MGKNSPLDPPQICTIGTIIICFLKPYTIQSWIVNILQSSPDQVDDGLRDSKSQIEPRQVD